MSEPSGEIHIEEVERPTPDPNEVLIEMKAASICGSDIHHVTGEIPIEDEYLPLILGHEGAGIVAEVGAAVDHLEPGDRVAVHYVVACGHCRNCARGHDNRCRNRASVGYTAPGLFAEYVCLDARSAVPLPVAVPFDVASIVGCAVATGYHAVRTSGLQPGDTAAVFGIGGVGAHAVLFADFFGAARVIGVDPDETQHDLATAYGVDDILDPTTDDVVEYVMDTTDDMGVDVALECSGNPKAMEQAFDVIDSANQFESGTAVSVGFQSEPFTADYWGLREGALKVSGDHTLDELVRIFELIAAGKLDLSDSITHRIPFEEINKGVDIMMNGNEPVCRVVLEF